MTDFAPQLLTSEELPFEMYKGQTGLGDDKWLTRGMICEYIDNPCNFNKAWNLGIKQAKKYDDNDGDPKRVSYFDEGTVFEHLIRGNRPSDKGPFAITPEFCRKANGEQVPFNFATKDGKSWRDEKLAQGIPILKPSEYARVKFWYENIKDTAFGRWFLGKVDAGCVQHDITIRWHEEVHWIHEESKEERITIIPMQIRIDHLIDELILMDDKTTAKRLESWDDIADTLGYAMQDVMYFHGASKYFPKMLEMDPTKQRMLFNVAEKKHPFRARICDITDEQRMWTSDHFQEAVEGIAAAKYLQPGEYEEASRVRPYSPQLKTWLRYKHQTLDGDGSRSIYEL